MSSSQSLVMLMIVGCLLVPISQAGPLAYAACQTACAAGVVACYGSAGLVFGTVTAGVGAPAAAVACNLAFAKCSAACAALLVAPTP